MKNERVTAQFHAARAFRAMTCVLFSINEYSSRTIKSATIAYLLKFLRNGFARMEFLIEWQPDDSDDLPNLQRSARIAGAPLEKDRLLYKEFDTLDGALGWARHVNDGGRVALLIEGDDGTHLGKREIAGALHHREAPPG